MDDNYVMIPNNIVQNITYDKTNENSYIQLYGKRTVIYLRQLIELQNINNNIYFSSDLILWMSKIQTNIPRERKYLIKFFTQIHEDSLINFHDKIDFVNLSPSRFIIAKLNIYEYSKDGKIQNYFMLKDSEYDSIMGYSGNLDKYNLLNLFCNIKSRIKRNANDISPAQRVPEVAYPSYETIMHDIFIESDKALKQIHKCFGRFRAYTFWLCRGYGYEHQRADTY